MRWSKPFPAELPADFVARVWSHLVVRGPDECWEAKRPHRQNGYGHVDLGRGRKYPLHRAVYRLVAGVCPAELHVLHRCDNKACGNPAHLFLGTHSTNMRDMVAKGRERIPCVRGEAHGAAKLTATQVREIRTRYALGGVTQRALAQRYGVDQVHVSGIVLRKFWRHVA